MDSYFSKLVLIEKDFQYNQLSFMKQILLFLAILALTACKDQKPTKTPKISKNDTITAVKERDYKVLDSKEIDVDSLWAPF